MSDVPPRPQDSVEQRLGLVARGVQRMADAFGSLEQRLAELADAERLQALSDRMDEYRVRGRSEVAQISERMERMERLESENTRALELLAVAIGELRVETTASIERVITEQNSRLGRLHDALGSARESPTAGTSGGDRLAAIENVIASLRDELAIDRLEASMRDMAQDQSGLRADVRKSFDRVLHSITTAEESLTGEVRAIDHRLSGMGDDLRLVRGMRDGLEALSSGIDSVRQLAARSATSGQMGELARDLSTVLAEIETARAHVLSVDQQVGRAQAEAIDIGPPPREVQRTVEKLERTVSDEIGDLGRRIEELADSVISNAAPAPAPAPDEPPDVGDQIALRLKSLATSARQLGLGMAEDLRARRSAKGAKGGRKR